MKGEAQRWIRGIELAMPRGGVKRVPVSNARHNASDALRAGFTIEEIFNLTRIDRWFLLQIKEIVDFDVELAAT